MLTVSNERRFITGYLFVVSVMLVFVTLVVIGGIKSSVNDGELSETSANALITLFGAFFFIVGSFVVALWIKRDDLVKQAEMEQRVIVPRHVFLRMLWRIVSVSLTNAIILIGYHGLAVLSVGYVLFLMQSRPENYAELVNYPGSLAAVGMALYIMGVLSSETQRAIVNYREMHPIRQEDLSGVRKHSPSFKDKPLFNLGDKIIMLSRRKDQFSVGTVKRLATLRWDFVHRYDIDIESSTEPTINPGDTYLRCSELFLRPYYDRIENVN